MVNLRRVFSSLGYLGGSEHPACISVAGTAVLILSLLQMLSLRGRMMLSRGQGASGRAGRRGYSLRGVLRGISEFGL